MSAFEISRMTQIAADPARVHALVNDFRQWQDWSPWEGLDPALEREYDGPQSGVGASYSWSGNRKAGVGSMRITDSTPEQIDVDLSFVKPFRADNRVTFELVPANGGTQVTWKMTGVQTGLSALFGKLVPMDRLVGKDFEKGLARLKTVAES